jgi:hypothetical protein
MMPVNVLAASLSKMQDRPVVGGCGWVNEWTSYIGVPQTKNHTILFSPSHFFRLIFNHTNHSAGLVKAFY